VCFPRHVIVPSVNRDIIVPSVYRDVCTELWFGNIMNESIWMSLAVDAKKCRATPRRPCVNLQNQQLLAAQVSANRPERDDTALAAKTNEQLFGWDRVRVGAHSIALYS
jgi:hypothetical protein